MAPAESEDVAAHAGRSFSKDLERGPDVLESGHAGGEKEQGAVAAAAAANNRNSTVSMPSALGIGSAISSSNSSIMGDPEALQGDFGGGEEWGPMHPCFPHRNPHVPVDSPEYVHTRIIRIRRDWLIAGDLAPTFSNLYPEILDPAGLSEQEFRKVIDKLNGELVEIFRPTGVRNVVDSVMGLVTGWLWDDFGLTGAKARLAKLERWIERWNELMATSGDGAARGGRPPTGDEAAMPPKIIPLRQTGYMTLDIQIGDPEIAPVPSPTPVPPLSSPIPA